MTPLINVSALTAVVIYPGFNFSHFDQFNNLGMNTAHQEKGQQKN
jgi:hypothetical protein